MDIDILRFVNEINSLDWNQHTLVFLDEISFDNRGMLRSRGWCRRGQRLLFRGEFKRTPRVSVLCFIGASGVLEVFQTEGTFDRLYYLQCLQSFITRTNCCQQYPGHNSVWIMDGAKIHCHRDITHYLRSTGIVPVFLPAYCPFYNPIELVFGQVKRRSQQMYQETKVDNCKISYVAAQVFNSFKSTSFIGLYRKCGYQSRFDPSHNYPQISSTGVNKPALEMISDMEFTQISTEMENTIRHEDDSIAFRTPPMTSVADGNSSETQHELVFDEL